MLKRLFQAAIFRRLLSFGGRHRFLSLGALAATFGWRNRNRNRHRLRGASSSVQRPVT